MQPERRNYRIPEHTSISETKTEASPGGDWAMPPQESDPILLAEKALADLEKLHTALDDPNAHWLHVMIDVLRVYVDQLPVVPNQMVTSHINDGIILRRGLQCFVVSEDEFSEIRNAFRRYKHYRKRQHLHDIRRGLTSS